MVRREPGAEGRARVIASVTGDTVQVLLEDVGGGVTILDVSEVDQIDAAGLHALARLQRERCTLSACPRWLELWLARLDRNTAT